MGLHYSQTRWKWLDDVDEAICISKDTKTAIAHLCELQGDSALGSGAVRETAVIGLAGKGEERGSGSSLP